MSLTLRYMRVDDIPEVVAIDRVAFSMPWTAQSYTYEVAESPYSYMAVLEQAIPATVRGWRRWLHRLSGHNGQLPMTYRTIGYGGLWNIADEAHISTIAVHPDFRGKGYGELLLAGMIRRSILLNASYLVLEVRVSNHIAQNLYHKYDFTIAGTKRNYYHDDMEDAYDMRLDLLDGDVLNRFQTRYTALRERIAFADAYTDVTHHTPINNGR